MAQAPDAKTVLSVGENDYQIYTLQAVTEGHVERLPFSLKILLENLLRHADGDDVSADDISAIANWDPASTPSHEISFTPARVILQDFTGVPAVVDLAAMRDAVVKLGGKADAINPLSPAELVIDHSVQVDNYGTPSALAKNNVIEFERNKERYSFLRWGQNAFRNFRVVPPNTGIVHQVNLEYLARVIFDAEQGDSRVAYPDTVVGTDSHTTMINGLGVLGWGVGGIEAEAAMLGQPITMLIPQVIGFRLTGGLPEGATLSAGSVNTDDSMTLTPAQLEGLTVTPPTDSDADFTLSVTATATEGAGGSTASTSADLVVTVGAVADTPALTISPVSGCELPPGLVPWQPSQSSDA